MATNKYLVLTVLYLIHLLSVNFYFLLDIESLQKDIIFLFSIFILLLNIRFIKTFIKKEDKYIFLFAIYGIFSTCIMAYFNYGQTLTYSLLVTRLLIIIAVLFIALNFLLKNISLKALYKMAFFISIFVIFFAFYLYLSNNLSILYLDKTLFRLGTIRITIAHETLIVLILFFYYHSKEKFISYIPFIGLLLVLLFVDKTRGTLIAILIILLLSSLNLKKSKNLIIWYMLFLFSILSFVLTDFESSIFQPLLDIYYATQEEVTGGKGNVNFRAIELAYFWDIINYPSIIFGYGMDNKAFKILYYENFYLSDLGIFKVFYLHGIIGLLLFIGIYYQMYKQASLAETSVHKTGKALVLFQLFAPSLNFTYHIEGMFMFFIIYILIKNYNIRNNLNG